MTKESTYPLAENISIETQITVDDITSVTSTQQLYGGIRLKIGSESVTRYSNEEDLDANDEEYEYKGEYPFLIIRSLLSKISDFAYNRVDPTRSTESRVELYESAGYIVFSWLNSEYVRVAFQTVPVGAQAEPTVPIHSSVGYAVQIGDLVSAILEASKQILHYIEESSVKNSDSVTEFRQQVKQLSSETTTK